MISNLSLSAFSATNLRPTEPRTPSAPVQPPPAVERVRAQADVRPTTEALSLLGPNAQPPTPGKPAPRGSLLDLSV